MNIPLDDIPLVDNHCHGIRRTQDVPDSLSWRRYFTEASDPAMARDHVPHTLFYRRLIREMAAFLGCEPDEEAVLAARSGKDGQDLIQSLLRAANIESLLIDQGYPPPSELYPNSEITAMTGIKTHLMLRLELRMQDFILSERTLPAVEDALREELHDIRRRGFVALKSIVAYRTGLEIREWYQDEIDASYQAAREEGKVKGSLRLAHKPLLDHLLLVAFREAARQEVPVQFHTGYGDTDTDLRLGDPLHLRWVLEHPDLKAMPVVLLHESYPFTRKSGYLASVYTQAWVDLSYGIPFIGYDEMVAFTRQALGVAPISKIMYSSDAVGAPELHWSSAVNGRRAISEVLGSVVRAGELSADEAREAGKKILRDNATQLYRL